MTVTHFLRYITSAKMQATLALFLSDTFTPIVHSNYIKVWPNEWLVLIYGLSKKLAHFLVLVPYVELMETSMKLCDFEIIEHHVNINLFENNYTWLSLSRNHTNSRGEAKKFQTLKNEGHPTLYGKLLESTQWWLFTHQISA